VDSAGVRAQLRKELAEDETVLRLHILPNFASFGLDEIKTDVQRNRCLTEERLTY
jgi:hypothetical protein